MSFKNASGLTDTGNQDMMTMKGSGKEMAEHDLKFFRKFIIYRTEDEGQVSGTGIVAEGVQFSSGRCVIAWLSETPSVAAYDNITDILKIHGHGGKTVVRWIDQEFDDKEAIGNRFQQPQ